MKWLKKIFAGDKATGSTPVRSAVKSVTINPTGNPPRFVLLPDHIHQFVEEHLANPTELNGSVGTELMGTRRFEEALALLLAHTIQSGDQTSLYLSAGCCKQIVAEAATSGNAGDDHDLLLSSGIQMIEVHINHVHPESGEPYSLRADLFLMKAQWEQDEEMLDRAERDYEKAIALGSSDPSNLTVWQNNLESVATVRRTLF